MTSALLETIKLLNAMPQWQQRCHRGEQQNCSQQHQPFGTEKVSRVSFSAYRTPCWPRQQNRDHRSEQQGKPHVGEGSWRHRQFVRVRVVEDRLCGSQSHRQTAERHRRAERGDEGRDCQQRIQVQQRYRCNTKHQAKQQHERQYQQELRQNDLEGPYRLHLTEPITVAFQRYRRESDPQANTGGYERHERNVEPTNCVTELLAGHRYRRQTDEVDPGESEEHYELTPLLNVPEEAADIADEDRTGSAESVDQLAFPPRLLPRLQAPADRLGVDASYPAAGEREPRQAGGHHHAQAAEQQQREQRGMQLPVKCRPAGVTCPGRW